MDSLIAQKLRESFKEFYIVKCKNVLGMMTYRKYTQCLNVSLRKGETKKESACSLYNECLDSFDVK